MGEFWCFTRVWNIETKVGNKSTFTSPFFFSFHLIENKNQLCLSRGETWRLKGKFRYTTALFWHAESQPMWLETLTDKRRALRTEVKPASESSPLADDHKTTEKCTKQCSSSMCHVYTQTFRQKAKLGGIFKALGLMAEQKLHSAAFLGWLLSYSACQSYQIQW